MCYRKGNSDQWEYERKLCRWKGTVTKGKMEGALKTERNPSTKQGNADHLQHKGTLQMERKPCTKKGNPAQWEDWRFCEESLMHLNAFHLHSDNCFTRNLVRN